MNKRAMVKELKQTMAAHGQTVPARHGEGAYQTVYLGASFNLDPCGRHHEILSPNGVTSRCERYWERLEAAAKAAGGWISGSDGDGCDVFFGMPIDEE